MLEVGSDLVASSQIQKERERVDVSSSSKEHCQLGWNEVKERTTNQRASEVSSLVLFLGLAAARYSYADNKVSENSHCCDQPEGLSGFVCAPGGCICKRYKSSNDEHGIEDMALEGEQGQTHVGENEVLCQEI